MDSQVPRPDLSADRVGLQVAKLHHHEIIEHNRTICNTANLSMGDIIDDEVAVDIFRTECINFYNESITWKYTSFPIKRLGEE